MRVGIHRKVFPSTLPSTASVFLYRRTTPVRIIQGTAAALYGLAPYGWMLYVVILLTLLQFLAEPCIQSIMARLVGADGQGSLQVRSKFCFDLSYFFKPCLGTTYRVAKFGFWKATTGNVHFSFFHQDLLRFYYSWHDIPASTARTKRPRQSCHRVRQTM